jgi:hypothetical protein
MILQFEFYSKSIDESYFFTWNFCLEFGISELCFCNFEKSVSYVLKSMGKNRTVRKYFKLLFLIFGHWGVLPNWFSTTYKQEFITFRFLNMF